MEHGFYPGVFFGTIIGSVSVILVILSNINTTPRQECEKNLPRSQKCVSIWVPETKGEK